MLIAILTPKLDPSLTGFTTIGKLKPFILINLFRAYHYIYLYLARNTLGLEFYFL